MLKVFSVCDVFTSLFDSQVNEPVSISNSILYMSRVCACERARVNVLDMNNTPRPVLDFHFERFSQRYLVLRSVLVEVCESY